MAQSPGFRWRYDVPDIAEALRQVARSMARPHGAPPPLYLEDHPPEHRSALSDAMRQWLAQHRKDDHGPK
jgi:hypothetical protein